jgi:uncharacterized protein (DUF885 family)
MDTGDRARQKSEIDDGSEAGIGRQKALTSSQLARLKALDHASLTAADAVSYDVVMYGLRTNDDANRAFRYGAGQPYVLSQLTGSYRHSSTTSTPSRRGPTRMRTSRVSQVLRSCSTRNLRLRGTTWAWGLRRRTLPSRKL